MSQQRQADVLIAAQEEDYDGTPEPEPEFEDLVADKPPLRESLVEYYQDD